MSGVELLDKLVGAWQIRGTMRGLELAQKATASWVLNGKFVEVRVTDGTPLIDGKPYEAVYFIGPACEGGFVMVLLDVFGVSGAPVPGLGRRDGDSLVFEFAYASGPWTWRWTPSGDAWDLEQSYLEHGEWQVFALKRMARVSTSLME